MVAVGLLHLLVVDVRNLHLRFGGLRGIGEEGDEVLVLSLGLRVGRLAALFEPTVAHGQLGAHPILRLGIGVEHGLQVEAGYVIAAFLQGHHGLVKEFLVRLFGVHAGQRVRAQVVGLLFLVLGGALGRNAGQHQNRQSHRRHLQRQPVHISPLWRRPRRDDPPFTNML